MAMSLSRRRQAGWWYPWIFVVGMLVVVVVNAVMITLAIGTFPGLDTEDAYRKGIAYNQTLAAAEAQAERGWQASLSVKPASGTATQMAAIAPLSAEIDAGFVDRAGQPLGGLEVRAYLVRPTHDGGNDLVALLEERGGGRYVATVAVPLPGQWDVRLHARRGDETFQLSRRAVIQ